MTCLRIIQIRKVDAFTDKPLLGNPAGVVFGADQLTKEDMLRIASELNISETVFILSPTSKEANFKLKFYTPTCEVDLCGHATIAASHYLVEEDIVPTIEPVTIINYETNVGVLPVEVYVKESKPEIIYMTQAKPKLKDNTISINEVAKALRIDEKEILDTKLPLQIASTGLPFLIIPLRRLSTLLNLKPNLLKIHDISSNLNVTGFHIFTFETVDKDSTVHTRCFAPYVGVNEDPVTGTANGALGAYLVQNRIIEVKEPYTTIISEQGYAMKRPGKVHVKIEVQQGRIERVKVGGRAVTSLKGWMRLD